MKKEEYFRFIFPNTFSTAEVEFIYDKINHGRKGITSFMNMLRKNYPQQKRTCKSEKTLWRFKSMTIFIELWTNYPEAMKRYGCCDWSVDKFQEYFLERYDNRHNFNVILPCEGRHPRNAEAIAIVEKDYNG